MFSDKIPTFSRLKPWQLTIALVTAAFVAYAPALCGEPIWDDAFLVGSNPFFRSPLFVWEVFRHWLFPDAFAAYYRPVQNLSYLADYLVWRGEPFGYHLTNILLHGGAAVFLFLLLQRLIGDLSDRDIVKSDPQHCENPTKTRNAARWIAFGIAGIWVVHPVHNAAIAYIAGRADSLAALFALGGWLLFLKAREQNGILRIAGFAAAWIAGLLALCSKEIAITWLVLFAVMELRGHGESSGPARRRAIAILGGLAAMLAGYWCLRHLPDPRPTSPGTAAEPIPARILLMLRALGDYTGLMVYPANLHMCRTVSNVAAYASSSAWRRNIGYEYLSLLGGGTLAIFAFGCCSPAPGRSLRRLGAVWFLIGFLPVSNLFSLNAQVAEHWIYMPSIGFLVFVAGWGLALPRQWRRAATAIICLAAIAFIVRTRERSADWAAPDRFYWSTIQSGGVDPRLLLNFAKIYSDNSEYAKAERILRAVTQQWPEFAPARIALGRNLLTQGREAEAEPLLRTAGTDAEARLFAGTWMAQVGLAKLEVDRGQPEKALSIVTAAIASHPAIDDLVRLKVELLQKTGRTPEALALAQETARKAWWNLDAQQALARLLLSNGKTDAALSVLRNAAWLDVWATKPLILAARVELSRDRPAAALEWISRAIRRKPLPSEYLLLSETLHRLHREQEAGAALRRAGVWPH